MCEIDFTPALPYIREICHQLCYTLLNSMVLTILGIIASTHLLHLTLLLFLLILNHLIPVLAQGVWSQRNLDGAQRPFLTAANHVFLPLSHNCT